MTRVGTTLLGASLLLIGLMAGIILALVAERNRIESSPRPVVERVQVGVVRADTTSGDKTVAQGARELSDAFRTAADIIKPTVVFVEVYSSQSGRHWFRGLENRFFDDQESLSVGSGVILSEDGFVVTNYHVVEDAERIRVTLADKRQYDAEVVGIDRSTDLAVMQLVDALDMPNATLGDSDALDVGDWVLAVGNPFRLNHTVTAGIISALGRQVNVIGDRLRIEDFIQTDAAINPGNSGGALVDLNGNVVGISTAIATESGSYEGYGFAVPVNLVARVASDLIAFGEVKRGYLGVEIADVTASTAKRAGLEHIGGVYLSDVWSNGAADRAGLRAGDIIVAIEGSSLNSAGDLQSAVARQRPGDPIQLRVWRGNQEIGFVAILQDRDNPSIAAWFEERQDQTPDERRLPEMPTETLVDIEPWGLGVRNLSEAERDIYGTRTGVYIAYVHTSSHASASGLQRDAVITEVENVTVESVDDLVAALERYQDTGALCRTIGRDRLSRFYELRLTEDD